MRTTALYDPIKTMSRMTDKVLVAVSVGKDSAVVLDLCCKFFKHVTGFFMHIVPGLSFQERILQYYEKRYGIEILRFPHFMTSDFYRYGTFRPPDFSVPIVGALESYNYARELTGAYWIAAGERVSDSIVRRAMILSTGSIVEKRGRFFPVAYWNKKDIIDYIRVHRLRVGEESARLGFSFRSLAPHELIAVRKYYPKDYEIIKHYFPLADVSIKHYEYNPQYYDGRKKGGAATGNEQNKQVPEV